MPKKIFIVICLFLISMPAFSEENTYQSLYNTIGLNYTNISGYGFFYNRKISDNFKVQLMGLAFYYYSEKEGVTHTIFNYDIGLELQENMFIWSSSRLYLLVGGYYYRDDDRNEGPGENFKKVLNHSFNTGIGIAYEYIFSHFVINLSLGYKFFEDNIEITENNSTHPELNRIVKIGSGIAVGFMF